MEIMGQWKLKWKLHGVKGLRLGAIGIPDGDGTHGRVVLRIAAVAAASAWWCSFCICGRCRRLSHGGFHGVSERLGPLELDSRRLLLSF